MDGGGAIVLNITGLSPVLHLKKYYYKSWFKKKCKKACLAVKG